MKRKLLLTALILFLDISKNIAFSQSGYTGYFLATPPPSPNAANLGVYGLVPQNFYSGTPNINLPLYLIKNRDLNFEISLSYHILENKVEQEASWVGLGWSLNAGGVITRTKNGLCDLTENGGVTYSKYDDACEYYQPDIFYYNFCGYSGRFILDQTGKAIQIHKSDLIIKNIDAADAGFVIICPNGVKYYFSQKEYSISKEGTIITYEYPSAWYLKRIVSLTGHEITFNYSTNTFPSKESYSIESYLKEVDWNCSGNCSNVLHLVNGEENIEGGVTVTHNNIYLTSIESELEIVNFETKSRNDLCPVSSSYLPQMLSQITIYDKINKKVYKRYKFNTSYFDSGGTLPDYQIKRLKLSSIEEKDLLNESHSLYSFEYITSVNLPQKKSKNTDYWGYYNGNVNADDSKVQDRIFNSNGDYSKANLLSKIVYPTGGYTLFEYEENDFSNRLSITKGCGNRINKIINYDGTIKTAERRYEYFSDDQNQLSSGKLIVPADNSYSIYWISPCLTSIGATLGACITQVDVKSKGNTLNLGAGDENIPVGYSRVVEYFDANGSQGKNEYEYENNDVSTLSRVELLSRNIQVPRRNGLLTSQRIYKRTGDSYYLLREISNTYSEEDLTSVSAECPNIVVPLANSTDCTYHLDYELYSSWIHPSSTILKEYDENNPLLFSEEVKNFYYGSSNHKQLTKEESLFYSDIYTTEYRYADEFTDNLVLNNMFYSYNEINIPIEVINKKNGNVTSTSVTSFLCKNCINIGAGKFKNGFPKPEKTYVLEADQPLTDYQMASLTLDLDNRITPITTFDQYDNDGNILQYHTEDNYYSSFIWGYKNLFPIAKIENATVTECYYNGFEDEASYSGDAHTGKYCRKIDTNNPFAGDTVFDKSILRSGKYVYSGWFKTSGSAALIVKDKISQSPYLALAINNTNGKWKYYELVVDINSVDFIGCSKVGIEIYNPNSTLVLVDDVSFRPLNSQITTYTYEPLLGMTSETDMNGITTYYEYDTFGRLRYIKDNDFNILKRFEYHYKK